MTSPEVRLGVSDVCLLSGPSGLSFDSAFFTSTLIIQPSPSPAALSALPFFFLSGNGLFFYLSENVSVFR